MKKSTMVTLVLSGALISGCNKPEYQSTGTNWESGDQSLTNDLYADQSITNNTYEAGRGYYHAPYHSWFDYPYNYYRPGYGYYQGGMWSSTPHESTITSSRPGSSGSSISSSHLSSSRAGTSSGISRGGFGHSASASS